MSRIITLLILLAIGFQSAQAQRYSKRKIRKDLEELPGFKQAFVAFELYNPDRDQVIAEKYSNKFMTPASNTKLFTLWAFSRLGDFELVPALEFIEKGDSLVFWSTGYPLTLHPDHSDSTVIEFLRSSPKDLYYWPRPMVDQRFGPGWGWDDYPYYFGAEKSVFPIYGNSIRFIVNSTDQTYEMSPNHQGFQVRVNEELKERVRLTRDEFWNEFDLHYKKVTANTELVIDTLIRPFRYSNTLFADLLSGVINKEIQTIDDFKRPEDYQTLKGVPTDSLNQWMMKPSDNLMAESMLLMISGFMSDTLSTTAGIDSLALDGLNIVDGSGLSRYNMFTPDQITHYLRSLYGWYGEDLLTFLPQGGTSGTLKDWYGPYVFAKTGTLSNNHALSGFIKTKRNNLLAFSIMVNHYTEPTSTIRESIGVILEKIYNAY